MTALEDDIARIAALRGRGGMTSNYVQEAKAIERRSRGVYASEIRELFVLTGARPRTDVLLYDHLPERSRRLLRDVPFNASSEKYADLLARMANEASLVTAVEAELPGVIHDWTVKHYGLAHPSAAKDIS